MELILQSSRFFIEQVGKLFLPGCVYFAPVANILSFLCI